MRLIQQTPAWGLHAYLRILDLDYETENTVSFQALGLQVPVMVDQSLAKSEALAMNYLARRYGGFAMELSTESVFLACLKQKLGVPFSQLKRVCKVEETEVYQVLPTGFNYAVGIMSGIRDFFAGERYDVLPGATEQELIDDLQRVYQEIDESLLSRLSLGLAPTFTQFSESEPEPDTELDDSTDRSREEADLTPPTSPTPLHRPPKASKEGISEAVLYGHMAEVLCMHEKLAAVLTSFEGLVHFFNYMSYKYFTAPYQMAQQEEGDRQSWKRSMDALLNNPFFSTPGSRAVRVCLLEGVPIACTLPASKLPLPALSAAETYEGDLYPDHEQSDGTNPLAHHEAPPVGTGTAADHTPVKARAAAVDPHRVDDAPTVFGRVGVDLSLSRDWRRAFQRIGGLFGAAPALPGKQDEEEKMVPGSGALRPHNVTLGGVVMLLSVAGCFAGYAYQINRSRR